MFVYFNPHRIVQQHTGTHRFWYRLACKSNKHLGQYVDFPFGFVYLDHLIKEESTEPSCQQRINGAKLPTKNQRSQVANNNPSAFRDASRRLFFPHVKQHATEATKLISTTKNREETCFGAKNPVLAYFWLVKLSDSAGCC